MERLITNDRITKSRLPARLDLAQSGTGLVLGLFMWVHMFLVASIILGKGSFNFVAKTMELSFLSGTGHGYPSAVFFAVLCVFTLFIVHAALGLRKFPISWKQHTVLRSHMGMLKHQDTNYWYIQAITGFAMFFLGSVHLYVMLTHPGQIDPYLSADRFVSSGMWPLYLLLLIAVELHGTIGLYRLCMKWGWFSGKDPRQTRKKLQMLKQRITIFFLALGALAFLVFVIIGIGHRDRAGEPYAPRSHASAAVHPAASVPAPAPEPAKAAPAHQEKPEPAVVESHEAKAESHEAKPAVAEAHDEKPAEVESHETGTAENQAAATEGHGADKAETTAHETADDQGHADQNTQHKE